jgi:hypothetical protein
MGARLVLVSVLVTGSLLGMATPAMAAGQVDQQQLDTSGGGVWAGVTSLAQTFTAGATGDLDSVALAPVDGFPITGYALEIRTVSDGAPTTTVVASQPISGDVVNGWVTTTFTSPASVVPGTKYAIVLTPPTLTQIHLLGSQWYTNPYHGGKAMSFGNGVWGTFPPLDLAFITYVTGPRTYAPDGLIAKGSRPYSGNDIYNNDGRHQTSVATAPVGGRTLFRIAIQNDGNLPDQFTVQATGPAAPGFRIRYYRQESIEITGRVVDGTFTTPMLLPGDRYVIYAWVKATASGPSTSRHLTITSVGNPEKVDAVKFIVRPR